MKRIEISINKESRNDRMIMGMIAGVLGGIGVLALVIMVIAAIADCVPEWLTTWDVIETIGMSWFFISTARMFLGDVAVYDSQAERAEEVSK